MSLSNVFDIAGSGMNAQSIRINTTASNIANAESASSSVDETYRARKPWFAVMQKTFTDVNADNRFETVNGDTGAGVQVMGIVEKDAPLQQRFQPDHPMANEDGYVYYPNVNIVEELVAMIEAQRAYEISSKMVSAVDEMLRNANQTL